MRGMPPSTVTEDRRFFNSFRYRQRSYLDDLVLPIFSFGLARFCVT